MSDQTSSEIDALGERLRRRSGAAANIRALERYRQSFVAPYETVMTLIRADMESPPTGRPGKSTASIVAKLARGSMRLSQMQDIAGCRIVVPDRDSQQKTIGRLSELFPGSRVQDLRARPSYGYRAGHVIPTIDQRRGEIQVRTRLQHYWAELSETLALGHAAPQLKYGGDAPDLPGTRDRLLTLSDMIANFEEAGSAFNPIAQVIVLLGIGLTGYTMEREMRSQSE